MLLLDEISFPFLSNAVIFACDCFFSGPFNLFKSCPSDKTFTKLCTILMNQNVSVKIDQSALSKKGFTLT